MKIYLDIFFLVNACIDFMVMLAVRMFFKRRTGILRILLSSILGAVLAVLIVIAGLRNIKWIFFPIYIFFQFAMIRIAFGKMPFGNLARMTAVYFSMTALWSAVLMQFQNLCSGLSVAGLFLISLLILAVFYIVLPLLWRKKEIIGRQLEMEMSLGDTVICAVGFTDTGNRLREPFGGEPVAVASAQILSPLLAKESLVKRVVPYHCVGNESGFLEAFRLDNITILRQGGEKVVIPAPWVAISHHPLSQTGDYDVILHPAMLQGKSIDL